MKTTKYFCDLCRKEFEPYEKARVEVSGAIDMTSGAADHIILELCRECGVSFFELIKEKRMNRKE